MGLLAGVARVGVLSGGSLNKSSTVVYTSYIIKMQVEENKMCKDGL